MKKNFSKLVASATILSTALLISVAPASAATTLFAGDSSAVSVNDGLKSIGITPYAIKDTLTWDLTGNVVDPSKSYSVTGGYPNVKLYAKNTGSKDFRIEVKHDTKNKVIFDKTVEAGKSVEVINNDSSPTVPSGNYTVTIYGGSGLPKGQVVLKSSDTPWQ
ncbi:hypothetical protein [Paenibacillus chitinolyticus]|uniref:Uncharacterized protein n=1 Tax=Paenibacillus chitinolyticus TaxID=79263 RepID=A0ABT4FCV7_9BACL|nr:hypothetical protein [Paenibacillus chitinolyticus]MCY9589993.1 hypothetical protein [Paenibacillus chitinolyticus]MCY9596330.1 hypothetical protein [Paenibacillus chitinolyticus]